MTTQFAPNRKGSASTGVLIDPDGGFGSAFAGDSRLPRSIASDGRRWVLFLHVLTHLGGLAFNILACIQIWDTFPQTQMQVAATVAAAMHGVGILCLLALAASEVKQIAFVVSLSFIYAFLLCGLFSSLMMFTFTFRSDDLLTDPHWQYYSAIFLQTLGISFLTACSLNMAAHADAAFSETSETSETVALTPAGA